MRDMINSGENCRIIDMQVDVIGYCNLRCRMCENNFWNNRENFMPFKFFCDIMNQAENIGVESVLISCMGEPTLHPQLPEMIELCKEKEFFMGLISNFNFSPNNKELLNVLSEVDSIKVSIDGATKETYENLRRNGSWSILLKNLENLNKIKKNTTIVPSFIIQKGNVNEIGQFVETFKDYADSIEIDPVVVWDINSIAKDVIPTKSDIKVIGDGLERAFERMREYRIKQSGYITPILFRKFEQELMTDGWMHFISYLQKEFFGELLYRGECYPLRYRPCILANGEVYPCDSGANINEMCIGDLNKQSIMEIWNSENIQKMRDSFMTKKPGVCKRCVNRYNYNCIRNNGNPPKTIESKFFGKIE